MKAKKIHKYLGIPLCFLLFLAALSGIILNHRDLLQSIDIPRAVLPSDYKFEKWNNGAVRGVLRADSLAYIYGGVGVWVTDSSLRREARPLHAGFVRGGDEAKALKYIESRIDLVKLPDGLAPDRTFLRHCLLTMYANPVRSMLQARQGSIANSGA